MQEFIVLVEVALVGAVMFLGLVLVVLGVRLVRVEKRLQLLERSGFRSEEDVAAPAPRAEVSPPIPAVAEEPVPSPAWESPHPVHPAPLSSNTPMPAAEPMAVSAELDVPDRPDRPDAPEEAAPDEVTEPPVFPAEVEPVSAAEPEPVAPYLTEPKRPSVDWEQWIGIRGAAVLGGLVLALAGLFFVKHSIDAGWLSPSVRVAMALLAGVGCIGLSGALARNYRTTSNALAGTGLILLYAGCWAGHVLYGLVHGGVAFAAMSLVTLVGGWLAWHRRSQVIAVLGLLGGFATPAFLSSLQDQPLQVFGYLLLLDVGLLFLGARRRWPVLGGLAMAGTLLYQVVWLLRGGSHEHVLLSLAVIAVFGMLFAASTLFAGERREQPPEGLRSGVIALLGAFALAGMLALQSDLLADHLLAYAGLLALLGVAAQSLSIITRSNVLGFGAAAAAVTSLLLVVAPHGELLNVGTATLALSLVAIAFALPVFALGRWKPQLPLGQAALAAAMASGGVAGVALLATWAHSADFYPMWLMVGGIAVVLYIALAYASEQRSLVTAAGLGLGFGLATTLGVEWGNPLLVAGIAGLLTLLANFLPLPEGWKKPVQHGSLFVWALPFLTLPLAWDSPVGLFWLATAILGWTLMLAIGSALWRVGWVYALGVVLAALAILSTSARWLFDLGDLSSASTVIWALLLFATLLVGWPFLWRRRYAQARFAWYGAVAALPLLVPSLYAWLSESQFDSWRGALALGLAAIAGGAFFAAGRLEAEAPAQRERALVGFGAVGLCFAALGTALFFGGQWVTVTLALQGIALIGLWRRFDHPVLKYLSLALFATATVRLLAGPWNLGRSGFGPEGILWNGISYAYLVPAAALLLGLYWMRPLEAERAQAFEQTLYRSGKAWGARALGAAAIGVIFTWINMLIANAFRTGPELVWAAGRHATRDLTQSLAWAAFAITLLILGITLRSKGLRWASLIFLVLTIAKVFLFDLGELQDLFRVFSLVGLAFALILVSLVYQRFVFRTPAGSEPTQSSE